MQLFLSFSKYVICVSGTGGPVDYTYQYLYACSLCMRVVVSDEKNV